ICCSFATDGKRPLKPRPTILRPGNFTYRVPRPLRYLPHNRPFHQTVIEMIVPTPTINATLPHVACRFETLTEGLDYAARGETGYNYYSVRGDLVLALPYRELRERSLSVARRLAGLGLPRGSRVGLVADT